MNHYPIRVLCLFTLLNRGGAETMCMNLYRNIDRSKVQFDFLVYYPQRGEFEDEIEALGGKVYRIPHLDFKNLRSHIIKARQFFREHPEYKIVHDHMGENGAFICREAYKSGIKCIIYHSHTDKGFIFNSPFSIDIRQLKLKMLYLIARRYTTDYFACGEQAAKVFRKGVKVYLIRNAIDVDKFRYNYQIRKSKREELNCGNKFVIVNVARINANKNQTYAIKIFQEVIKTQPNAELWLIGDGYLRNELQREVIRDGLEKKIIFFGVRSDVHELLQAADVFLFPSKNEGLPVSCIEAQAAGLPCVFSNGFDPAAVVTENCRTLSLNEPAIVWASAILNFVHFERKDTGESIKKAGYDIRDTARDMEKFYLSRIYK